MAILGQIDCAASTPLTPAAANSVIPGGLTANATVNILLANRTAAAIEVSVYIVPSGTSSPAVKHAIHFNEQLDGYNVLERGGIPLNAGDLIFINPGAVGISCSVVALS